MNVQTLFVKCIEKMLENDKNKLQFIIRHNTIFYHNKEDKSHILFFKNIISKELCSSIYNILLENFKSNKESIHYGVWGLYQSFLYTSSQGLTNEAMLIEKKLRETEFFNKASRIMEIFQTTLVRYLDDVNEWHGIKKTYGSFPSMAINKCFDDSCNLNKCRATNLHYDSHDSCLALLFCFGEYVDGNLTFPEMNLSLEFRPRDFVLFRGSQYLHGVEEFVGKRFSIVFFMHKEVDDNNNRKYYPMQIGKAKVLHDQQKCLVFPTVYPRKFIKKPKVEKKTGEEKIEEEKIEEKKIEEKKIEEKKTKGKKIEAEKNKSSTKKRKKNNGN